MKGVEAYSSRRARSSSVYRIGAVVREFKHLAAPLIEREIMPLRKKKFLAAGLTCIVILVSAACSSSTGSSTSSTTGSGTGGGSKTITIGVLTDASGAAASEFGTAVNGIKAGIGVAGTEGYKIKYVVADTATNPSQALSGAQKLVEQDHVFAVMGLSAFTFEASDYLTSNGIPVVGAAFDGPEWLSPKSTNMFSVIGNQDFTKVFTTTGLFLKNQGVTNVGTLGYSASPSSAAAARSAAVSAEAQGIKAGYVNDSFPFGSTNVAPVALAMKSAGVNGVVADTEPSTVFALATALEQEGVHLKATVLATGGGGDLINSGPAAVQAAQGDDFLSDFEPPEMHTSATQALQSALATYAAIHTDPTFAEYCGYLSVLGLVQGLKGAGSNPTQSSVIKSLSQITAYDASGLWGGHQTVDWSQKPVGPTQCFWMTKLSGSTFHLISGSDPVCGTVIPGKTV
jgi:ABC-type branched-subunit amino acid transport system substrate-binding protein